MRHGPNGPNTLCNACGMFWATQGRPRPEGVCEQDYVPTPPDGLENVKPPSRADRHQLEPTRAKNKEEMYDEELERLIDESELNEYSEQEDASDSERDSEGIGGGAPASGAGAATGGCVRRPCGHEPAVGQGARDQGSRPASSHRRHLEPGLVPEGAYGIIGAGRSAGGRAERRKRERVGGGP